MAIQVLIVDDSPLMQGLLTSVITKDPELQVCGCAGSAQEAREKIKALNPDVVTLDIEMPGMDGMVFLERLMRLRPTPVVMISSHIGPQSKFYAEARKLGAFGAVEKPVPGEQGGIERLMREVPERIKAAHSQMNAGRAANLTTPVDDIRTPRHVRGIVAFGSSTGGPEAVIKVMTDLGRSFDLPLVITQHMPGIFTERFAERLTKSTGIPTHLAETGLALLPGHAILAPSDSHVQVVKHVAGYTVVRDTSPPRNGFRPSVEVMFESLLQCMPRRTIAVMFSGMGADGSIAMKALRDRGAHCLAQDAASSAVFGMARAAIANGACDGETPLADLPRRIRDLARVLDKGTTRVRTG